MWTELVINEGDGGVSREVVRDQIPVMGHFSLRCQTLRDKAIFKERVQDYDEVLCEAFLYISIQDGIRWDLRVLENKVFVLFADVR